MLDTLRPVGRWIQFSVVPEGFPEPAHPSGGHRGQPYRPFLAQPRGRLGRGRPDDRRPARHRLGAQPGGGDLRPRVQTGAFEGDGMGGQAAGPSSLWTPCYFLCWPVARTPMAGCVSPWATARNNPTESASTPLAIPTGPGWRCAPTPCTAARSRRTPIAPMT